MSSAARDIRGTRAPPGVRAVAFAQVMTSALSAAVTVCKTVGSALALKQIEPAAGGPGLADGWAPLPQLGVVAGCCLAILLAPGIVSPRKDHSQERSLRSRPSDGPTRHS